MENDELGYKILLLWELGFNFDKDIFIVSFLFSFTFIHVHIIWALLDVLLTDNNYLYCLLYLQMRMNVPIVK